MKEQPSAILHSTLSHRVRVATEAVLDIAYFGRDRAVQAADITARQGTSRRSLEPILQCLTRHGLLIGLRGPRGGYQLAGDPSRITIADVAQVLARDHPVDVGAAPASALAQERLMPLWRRLESTVEHELNRVTIADLMITHEDRCAAD